MRLTFLGTGTSMGIPMIGCRCRVCRSTDPRDQRTRTSSYLSVNNKHIVIDTSIDFRQQMLREQYDSVDAILFTHHHADHIFGLDELRAINILQHKSVNIYVNSQTYSNLKRVYNYVFENRKSESDIPQINPVFFEQGPFLAEGIAVQPVPLWHGQLSISGFRIGNLAYCTDVSEIPLESFELLKNLDVLVLGALRNRPHPTHFTIEQAIAAAAKVGAKQTYLVHLSHEVSHGELENRLPEFIKPAYDGLKIEISDNFN